MISEDTGKGSVTRMSKKVNKLCTDLKVDVCCLLLDFSCKQKWRWQSLFSVESWVWMLHVCITSRVLTIGEKLQTKKTTRKTVNKRSMQVSYVYLKTSGHSVAALPAQLWPCLMPLKRYPGLHTSSLRNRNSSCYLTSTYMQRQDHQTKANFNFSVGKIQNFLGKCCSISTPLHDEIHTNHRLRLFSFLWAD